MKEFLIVILYSAMVGIVHSCFGGVCPRPPLCYIEHKLALSNRQQYRCERDSASLDYDLYNVKIEQQGATLRCREVVESDPDHDSNLKYPAVPEIIDNSETFAVASEGATQTVVCVNSKSALDQQTQLLSEGYFLAFDLKNNKNYVCADAHKKEGK